MGYVIISDSTCDLNPEHVEQLGVEFLPLTFIIDGKEYKNYFDEREMKLKQFYELLSNGMVATTSQLNVGDIQDYFRNYLNNEQDILYIAFSSGLSGTCNAARLAAEGLLEEFPNRKIEIVDSLCASSGEGILVYQAVKNKEAGMSLADNKVFCEEYKMRVRHWFTVTDIDTLRRGGRLTASKAFIAKVLNIKPVMNVDNIGKLHPVSKKPGRKTSIKQLVANSMLNIECEDVFPTFIGHADCLEEAEYAKELLEEQYKQNNIKSEIIITQIGPVIGAHSGPGTLAIFTVGKER